MDEPEHVSSFNSSQDAAQRIEDEKMDELINNLKRLKGHAKQTGEQLDNQKIIIEDISKNIDYGNTKIDQINTRLKKKFF